MLRVVLSDERRTWYREPLYAPYSARVVLCAAATLVAVPSYNESFGLVAIEAQACGTPVVAAAVGGLTTAVREGRSGLLVEGHGPAQWADALTRVAGDPALRARLAGGAERHAREFSWEATARHTLGVYERASEKVMA